MIGGSTRYPLLVRGRSFVERNGRCRPVWLVGCGGNFYRRLIWLTGGWRTLCRGRTWLRGCGRHSRRPRTRQRWWGSARDWRRRLGANSRPGQNPAQFPVAPFRALPVVAV